MLSSLEEAMSFFIKWSAEKTPLEVIYSGHGIDFKFSGFMAKVSRERGLVLVDGESLRVVLTASLDWARSFTFADGREASEEVRPLLQSAIECAWEIGFLKGDKLAMYERR
ncbi:MAG TPA: hypothetical protein VG204_15140 [Terriglobia bacterium]|nr:hypothetical protein [Terriglobia bacterium]